MQIVFIGPPGSGKGTQCALLSEALAIPHLSTGELLRRTKGGSPLGDLVSSYIDRGCFAPDFLILPLVMRLLSQEDFACGCLFDGFPRTVYQARYLERHFERIGQRIDLLIYLRVPEQEIVDRLLVRSHLEGRADDHRDAILKRLEIYQKRTKPVLNFYESSGLVREVNGSEEPTVVHAAIMEEVRKLRISENH